MKWKPYLIVYTILLVSIFIGAYLQLIPTEIKAIPAYDSIGHFVLYGIWGYLFIKVFPRKVFGSISLGALIIVAIAILEESLQSLSSVRTFSLLDLGWGLLGIFISWLLYCFEKR
jgi:polysaccharide biosynthesis protein VpsQ